MALVFRATPGMIDDINGFPLFSGARQRRGRGEDQEEKEKVVFRRRGGRDNGESNSKRIMHI